MSRSKTVSVTKMKALSIEQIHATERKLRKEIAQDYADHGHDDKVSFVSGTQTVRSLQTASDVNCAKFDNLLAKSSITPVWKIQQLTRQKVKGRDCKMGEYIKINAEASCVDGKKNEISYPHDFGFVHKPIWYTKTTFDEEGQENGSVTVLNGFQDLFTIPWTQDQYEALKPALSPETHFQINTGARKLTVTNPNLRTIMQSWSTHIRPPW